MKPPPKRLRRLPLKGAPPPVDRQSRIHGGRLALLAVCELNERSHQ